jgi:hypothetical protein
MLNNHIYILRGSNDGVLHSELLGFWTLSIAWYSKKWICFHPQVRGETPTLLGPLELVSITGPVTKGPNKVGVFPLA